MNVEYIECPNEYRRHSNTYSVFLAGGITNCSDWQQQAVELFKARGHELDQIILVNPRRESFDVTDPSVTDFQIEWEHRHLAKVHIVLFWFAPETLCPITLYELGVSASRGDTIFVGCDPQYQRKLDVVKQLSLLDSSIKVVDSLSDLVDQVVNYVYN